MCGIAGYVGAAPPTLLASMVATLKHRGPDDVGLHEAPGAGLGTARLAVIDLLGGHQPMGEPGRGWIAFNGEIYNHRTLRAELTARGHRFRTRSDTEVVLRAWEEHGEGCLDRLHGMFAFAVWDSRARRLLLARDRLGKKPLFYWQGDGLLLFASEIKALRCHPAVGTAVDVEALHHYLAFGSTPAVRSMVHGVAKLPPAHLATARGGALAVRRYWALPGPEPALADPREAAERTRAGLREAVRLRLESDVPLGVFLSGGVDSSAIVATLREVTSARIATVSIGFGDAAPDYDELPAARAVARRYETDHHEEVLEPDVAELLPALVHHLDEPLADSSAVPTLVVAQAAARHVKVALSGLGGDEAFGGYPRYLGLRVAGPWARLPRPVRGAARALLPRLLPDSERSRNWGDRVRRFVDAAELAPVDRYLAWTRVFDEAALDGLVCADVRRRWSEDVEASRRAAFASHGHGDPVDGAFRVDLAHYLPDDLLLMADRLGMACSLEVRAPFCDVDLLALSLALPPAVKLPGGRLKGLLKTALAGVLPREVLARPKQGFMVPLARWLRGPLRPFLEDALAPRRVRERGVLEPAAVDRIVREHLAGRRGHGDRLWALLMLELWLRQAEATR